MAEINVKIEAADLAAAINNLAKAIAARTTAEAIQTEGTQTVPVVPCGTPTETVVTNPIQNPANFAPQVPGAPLNATPAQTVTPTVPLAPAAPFVPTAAPVNVPASVPTSAPQYTLEMIATAGTSLIDAGKMNALLDLLKRYNVNSLTELQPTSYGAVANELRALGASI